MKSNFKKISIVVPVYNEIKSIGSLIERLNKSMSSAEIDYEIIVVDDNSTDGTWEFLSESNLKNIRSFKKEGRPGKAFSLEEGFSRATGDVLCMIDADLQYPPEAIPGMIKELISADVIVANRKKYHASFIRKILSTTFKFVFGKFSFGLTQDIQSGLKVFKKEVRQIIDFKAESAWTFDLEFLHRAHQAGFVIKGFDIEFLKRKQGVSKMSLLRQSFELGLNAISVRLKKINPAYIPPQKTGSMLGAGIGFKKKKYVTHTTMPHETSALSTLTGFQKVFILLTFFAIVTGLFLSPLTTAQTIVAILSFVYFIDVLFNLYLILRSLNLKTEVRSNLKEIGELEDQDLPIYTILCPLYKEAAVIPQFIEAISKISWPKNKLDVILLLEEDDEEGINYTKNVLLPGFVRTLIVPQSNPKTKPKACNFGLAHAKGEYVVIYDAEDIPDPHQLKKAYLGFQKAKENVICLQAKLNYYNPHQNLLTRLFTAEYSLWFDITLTGLQSIETTIPLGGTSNHFKTQSLREVQGWDPFNVTEDADLGVRLFKKGYKTAIINSTTYEEANSKLGNWIRQRSRWIKGYIQTYFVHMRGTKSKKQGLHSLIFQLVIGGKIAFVLINPILWLATFSYFAFHSQVGSQIEALYPSVVFYMAVFSLVFGNFLALYYYMIGVAQRGQWNLTKFVFLVPFYWLITSFASYIALYQLIFKPHYWEKTVHGLHLEPIKPKREYAKGGLIFPALAQIYSRRISTREQIWAFSNNISLFFSRYARVVKNNARDFAGLFASFKRPQPSGDKLRILIFNWRDRKHKWAGGAEVYIHELAKRWVAGGNSVTLFCANGTKRRKNETIDGIRIIRRGGFYTVYFWAFFYYIFKFRGKYDVIIDSENGIPFFTPLYASARKFLLIHHVHQEVFRKSLRWPFSTIAAFFEGKAMPFVYRNIQVITVSPSSKKEILAHNLSKTEPEIIYNGVDSEIYKPAAKDPRPTVLYLGRLQYYKSLNVFIKAAKRVLENIPQAQFVIAGEGSEKEKLIKYTKRLGIFENVKFLGYVSEKEKVRLFQKAWVFVNPSLMEGWGITTIEAAACGTPAVASNVPGLSDSIKHGTTGLLVKYGNYDGFAAQIIRILKNKKLRSALSSNANSWAKSFSWNESSKLLFNIITEEKAQIDIPMGAVVYLNPLKSYEKN